MIIGEKMQQFPFFRQTKLTSSTTTIVGTPQVFPQEIWSS